MSLKTAIIDDHSVTFRGVAELLRSSTSHQFLGSFPTLDDPALRDDGPEPTVVITDFTPGAPLAEGTLPRHLAVLVMSGSTRPEDVRAALRAGARGYLDKSTDVPTLMRAIAAVGCGDFYLGGNLKRALVAEVEVPRSARPEPDHAFVQLLTPREREIIVLVAEGLTHKQIGTRLGLSKATVDTYVHRARQKAGTSNKAGLTRMAIELQLLRPVS